MHGRLPRALFAEQGFNETFGGTCISLLAATFTHGDETIDLALVRNNQLFVAVLENDGDGFFIDGNKIFTTEGNVANAAIARQIDQDPADRTDIVVLHNVLNVCLNTDERPVPGRQRVRAPEGFQGLEFYLPKFLQADDVDSNNLIDIVTFAKDDGDALTIFPETRPVACWIPASSSGSTSPSRSSPPRRWLMAVGPFMGAVEYPDLAVGFDNNGGGFVMYFPDFGVEGFADLKVPVQVGKSVSSIAIADLGLPGEIGDLVVTDPVGSKLVFLSEGPDDTLAVQDQDQDIDINARRKVVVAPLRGEGQRDIVTVDITGANVHISSWSTACCRSSRTSSTPDSPVSSTSSSPTSMPTGDGDIAVVGHAVHGAHHDQPDRGEVMAAPIVVADDTAEFARTLPRRAHRPDVLHHAGRNQVQGRQVSLKIFETDAVRLVRPFCLEA